MPFPASSRRQFMTLTGAFAATLTLPAGFALAQNKSNGTLAPTYPLSGAADDWTAFTTYDPATNPDAAFYRSHVPLAKRISPFRATQAHPDLSADVSGGTLLAAYLTLDGSDRDANRTRYEVDTQNRMHVERS
ncbi:MAG: hypothetical protein WBQ60_01015 [Asticcacaulis sp.]